MSAEFEFITLSEDYDTVVALESRGVGMENPMMQSIAKRWCIYGEEEFREIVARESNAVMSRAQFMSDDEVRGSTGKIIAKAAGKAAVGAGVGAARLAGKGAKKGAKAAGHAAAVGSKKLSAALSNKFKEWVEHYGPIFKDKLKEMTNKATTMDNRHEKLLQKLHNAEIHPQDIRTFTWLSEVCYEDKPDLSKCVELANHANAIADIVKEYTVKVNQMRAIIERSKQNEDGSLEKIGYPSNAAIHRASGILGRFTEKDVKARPIAGNVIIVTRGFGAKEIVEFAIAREASWSGKVETLSKSDCQKALDAVGKIVKSLRDRSVRRGVFSYTGVYDEMDKLRENMANLEGSELRAATQRFKNAIQIEDAFTTALVRVGDGLMNWVQASIKAG